MPSARKRRRVQATHPRTPSPDTSNVNNAPQDTSRTSLYNVSFTHITGAVNHRRVLNHRIEQTTESLDLPHPDSPPAGPVHGGEPIDAEGDFLHQFGDQLGLDTEFLEVAADVPANPSTPHPKGQRGAQTKTHPLDAFIPFRDSYLDEFCRHEGLGEHQHIPECRHCKNKPGSLKCTECSGLWFLCDDCMVTCHAHNPLHLLQKWEDGHWQSITLREIGLRIQLGHDGLPCPIPEPKPGPLTVVDLNGIQDISVDYCGCGRIGASRPFVQLLRHAWWPATTERPRTVITFRLLKHFQALNVISKVNLYDYYRSLEVLVDPTGTKKAKWRYKECSRVIREYRNTRLAKRSGRAHDPTGVGGTEQGECCVDCPMCPQPGRNMPKNINDIPEEERWKFSVMIAVDANFKLKLKNRGLRDVALAPGWSYFVNNVEYDAHVMQYVDEPEMKHCDSSFSAVDHANTPTRKRFAVNGVGAVVCARHAFYHKHSAGDLRRGEAFAPMDYMVMSVLGIAGRDIEYAVVSYDIACSYSKNFFNRLARYPEALRLNVQNLQIKWAVPKFHLHAHGPQCQSTYSFNYTRHVGRTHGETVETGWADLNSSALSTREMAPHARHEVLDDIMGAINFRKTTRIGVSLHKNLLEAILFRDKNVKILDQLTQVFEPEVTEEWRRDVEAWENDSLYPNPYKETFVETSLDDVRLGLAKQEAEEASRGIFSLHQTTVSMLLDVGFDLEDEGRIISSGVASCTTEKEKIVLHKTRNSLLLRINAWRTIQRLYMPFIPQVFEAADDASADIDTSRPELIPLHLPSSLPEHLRKACGFDLVEKEARMRIGQAHDALNNLRRSLRVKMGLVRYKQIQINGPGQTQNTAARRIIGNLEAKQQGHIARYRAAYEALCVLDPDGSWTEHLKKLRKSDIVSPRANDPDTEKCTPAERRKDQSSKNSEGRHAMSWIWLVRPPSVADQDNDGKKDVADGEVNESMRIDWLKQRARHDRWAEEVDLTTAEMQRAVTYLEWRSSWWLGKVGSRPKVRPDIVSGLDAYARRQAMVSHHLAASFVNLWRATFAKLKIADLWAVETYPLLAVPPSRKKPSVTDNDSSDSSSDNEDLDSDADDRRDDADDNDDEIED
ncbi:hypothetical protein BC834DRAFT_905195 [Gloeopeniophorella convolvens]|nr:hypothetical protein BC834DRAFT_905195 [Gloeopeniophorella convolvens]